MNKWQKSHKLKWLEVVVLKNEKGDEMKIKKTILIASLLTLPMVSMAADPGFDNLTKSDMETLAEGFGANFTHNSLMGASKMGTLFGFQVGLTAASTTVEEIDKIAKRNTGAGLKSIANAGLVAAVGIPFGIAFEAVIVPKLEADGAEAESSSFAIKYNINDMIPILPVNLALRGVHSTAKFSFDQTVSNAVGSVKNETTVSGVQLLLSPMIPLVEPYIGVGLLNSTNKLTTTVSGIFDTAYSTGSSKEESVSGTQILAGLEVNLVLLKFGVEYSNAFDNSRIGAKLTFGF